MDALSDSRVWLSFVIAILLGGLCLVLGIWSTRRVGLLNPNAPAGETLGVGLGAGLLIFASWWATVGSGGRSAFTPVAVAFTVALVIARRSPDRDPGSTPPEKPARSSRLVATIVAIAFVVGAGLIYGSTMAPSPRNEAQPVEHRDQAFYSALGADLNVNGSESIIQPSGFDSIDGFPSQNWFHWGEMWLAAATIRISGLDPVLARHYVVLPLLLLAAAALTGTLVRRLARTSSRAAYLLGAAAILLLAPVPLLAGAFSGWWPAGLLFGITQYGLAVIPALLSLHIVSIDRRRRDSAALALFCVATVASMLPAHVVVAVLAIIGVGGVVFVSAIVAVANRQRPRLATGWRRVTAALGLAMTTMIWGNLTGHGLGAIGTSSIVEPFDQVWVDAVIGPTLAGGGFLAIPVAWFLTRKTSPTPAAVFFGTVFLVVTGGLVWGARMAQFDMFHLFFAGIAVFAAPVAAVAIWTVVGHLRKSGRVRLATVVIAIFLIQIEVGILPAVARLQQFGPGPLRPPIPLSILATIRNLPPDAKLAYACQPDEEEAFWNPALVSITAHTGRPVVPICYEEDVFSGMIGADPSIRGENPFFKWAPQRLLFPDETTTPGVADTVTFLRAYEIKYIYGDKAHPNRLVPEALRIASMDDVTIYEIP